MLQILSLKNNALSDDHIKVLSEGVAGNMQLISLDLSSNDLSNDKVLNSLLLSLALCPLQALKFNNCRINDVCINEIALYLKRMDIKHTLQILELTENKVTTSGFLQIL